MAGEGDRVLPVAERLAGGDADLLTHEINPGDQLRHRMLDLDAGVHLDEVVVTVAVDEELDGAGARVVHGPGHGEGGLVQTGPGGRRVRVGAGDSSMSFWWRRWTEQSRSPRCTRMPFLSPSTCTSM